MGRKPTTSYKTLMHWVLIYPLGCYLFHLRGWVLYWSGWQKQLTWLSRIFYVSLEECLVLYLYLKMPSVLNELMELSEKIFGYKWPNVWNRNRPHYYCLSWSPETRHYSQFQIWTFSTFDSLRRLYICRSLSWGQAPERGIFDIQP